MALLARELFSVPLATDSGFLLVTESGLVLTTDTDGGYLPGAAVASSAQWAWPPLVAGDPGTLAPGVVRLYRGWPNSAGLQADLAAGIAHVSVFPESGATRNTSRYAPQWTVPAPVTPTLSATVSGTTLTLSGSPAVGQAVIVQLQGGTFVEGAPVYIYRVQGSDTLTTIAAEMASLIPGATSSAEVVNLPPALAAASVVMDQSAAILVRQQQQRFRVSCWAPSPDSRDALCGAVDAMIADVELLGRFTTPDGSSCRLTYANTIVFDTGSKDRVWRRDICALVEYPTIQTQAQTAMAAGVLNLTH